MKIVNGRLFALNIPFIEAFAHSTKTRSFSDSIILQVTADDGTVGYGEGVARPYVTGESVDSCLEHIQTQLWPAITAADFTPPTPGADPLGQLAAIDAALPDPPPRGVIAWHAARSAAEVAVLDCLLRSQQLSLGALLPPKRTTVVYSGVITSSSVETAVQHAKRLVYLGIRQLKLKVGGADDEPLVAAVRRAVGDDVSLRLDANGAYSVDGAIEMLKKLERHRIDSAEQPIPRGALADLAKVKRATSIPVMVDESLVTPDDARALIEHNACDFFNLRLSKCGGLHRTLLIARMAGQAGKRLQLGCQVGETAVLSAAGRHLAAHLDGLEFVEGSYGTLLLKEDLGRDNIHFGNGGRAPVLHGPGLGVEIDAKRLEKYATRIVALH
ncbi:MAG: enolase [Nitrospirae bacterium]|nr:enolase [Nitrospirota bacterium]